LNLRKYLVLVAVMFFSSTGDVLLARGMKDLGPVQLSHPLSLIAALANPWVFAGILCLIGFFGSYMTALSWADLTYVLPATAFGYVLLALLSKYFLHENVSAYRWAGILLISLGVGWVTRGPELTQPPQKSDAVSPASGNVRITGDTA
jgi:drug/metabolite transporter (DMT)-like permease